MSDRIHALFAAQAVALSARCNQLTVHAVDDMRTKAEELLARDDPLRRAIIAFATGYEVLARDRYGLRKLGEVLQADLETVLNPDAPQPRHRRDLDD